NYYPRRRNYYHNDLQPQRRYSRRRFNKNQQRNQQGGRIRSTSRGPRQMRLGDFIPEQLRTTTATPTDDNRNLPAQFNIDGATTATTTTTTINTPMDALPERERFIRAGINNATQPFVVNENNDDRRQQQQRRQNPSTTSSFRRRQRRLQQQQYRQVSTTNNRFSALVDEDDNTNDNNDQNDVEVDDNIPVSSIRNNKKKTKKIKAYLEPNRILKWFDENSRGSKSMITSRGNQGYIFATASLYDNWVRVIMNYKYGNVFKKWKINQTNAKTLQTSAAITDLQIQLTTYWIQATTDSSFQKQAESRANMATERPGTNTTNATTSTVAESSGTNTTNATTTISSANTTQKHSIRETIDKLEKYILEYIHQNTLAIKKISESRIQIAKAELAEYKAFEDFEQIATPAQWNTHNNLKAKVKSWSIKNRNYNLLLKRVEYDMPPKAISKLDIISKLMKLLFLAMKHQRYITRCQKQ
ncbi:unnamed protein product, partial [Rotaria sp. Silwood2]